MAKGKLISTIARGGGRAGRIILKEVNPLDVLRVYLDYRKTAEIQITERERIWSERDKALAAIEAEKELLLNYFQHRFDERKSALEQFFELLRQGSNSKSADTIDAALEGILGIVNDSPLKDFESFRKTRREGRIIDI